MAVSILRWGWLVSACLLVAAIAVAVLASGSGELMRAVSSVSSGALAFVFGALCLNALAASLRFKVIAADVGHSIRFRDAVAVVSAGAVAGALFFQVAGQLIARGALMSRGGVPFASVVVMTTYERAVAAMVAALMAAGGAYYLFGQITLDARAGGAEFVKVVVGLMAASLAGAVFGFGRIALKAISSLEPQSFTFRLLRSAALTILVQVPMLAAFVAAAHGLSPTTPIADLTAACTIVMFAAAVPISLGGWGVREMSAVIALGAIGVGAGNALVAALIVGAGSLLVMLAFSIVSVRRMANMPRTEADAGTPSIDWTAALQWLVPCAVAVLILFQLFVPVGATRINVNLADPLAVLAGALFVVAGVSARQAPSWRMPGVNLVLVCCTVVLGVALLIGAADFGWTTWAVTNRFLGWFVLLGFAATGAMIVKAGGSEGLRVLLMTFAGATAAVVALDIVIVMALAAGIDLQVRLSEGLIGGFAGNRNGLAFQVLMALCALLAAARSPRLKVGLLAVLLAGLFLSGSRSGLGTAPFVLAFALYAGILTLRELALAIGWAALILAATAVPAFIAPGSSGALAVELTISIQRDSSMNERMVSFVQGLRMFMDHTFFGAGLGAFIRQNLGLGGAPLVIHSSPLWLLAETGIVGFLVFVVPAVYLLIVEFRRRERDMASNLIVLCLVAFAVMAQVHDLLFQRTLWLLLGAALALAWRPAAQG